MMDVCVMLENWGCDVKAALSRFIDDEEFYLECIAKFKKETGFELLGQCLTNKQFKEAYEYAHMLKGVAGNLGLTPIYEKLCILVELLRNYGDIKEFGKVIQLYEDSKQKFSDFCKLT